MKVQTRLSEADTKIAVELNFKHIDDFEPAKVAQQIGPLNKLLEMRTQLTQLLSKMEGNDKLEALLADVLGNTEQAQKLADELKNQAPQAEENK
jgi:type VI secretion system protein ImpB